MKAHAKTKKKVRTLGGGSRHRSTTTRSQGQSFFSWDPKQQQKPGCWVCCGLGGVVTHHNRTSEQKQPAEKNREIPSQPKADCQQNSQTKKNNTPNTHQKKNKNPCFHTQPATSALLKCWGRGRQKPPRGENLISNYCLVEGEKETPRKERKTKKLTGEGQTNPPGKGNKPEQDPKTNRRKKTISSTQDSAPYRALARKR